MAPEEIAVRSNVAHVLLLVLLAAPFLLNDFAIIAAGDRAIEWLVADYGSKLIALGIVALIPVYRTWVRASMPLARPLIETLGLALVCGTVIVLLDMVAYDALDRVMEGTALARFPELGSSKLYWLDMTFGLALTAVSEEFVFRSIFRRVLERLGLSVVGVILISSVAFALIHWSLGGGAMVFAFIAGVLLIGLFLRTGSVLPGIAVHYVVNVILFA